jgi:hypothetical protein
MLFSFVDAIIYVVDPRVTQMLSTLDTAGDDKGRIICLLLPLKYIRNSCDGDKIRSQLSWQLYTPRSLFLLYECRPPPPSKRHEYIV